MGRGESSCSVHRFHGCWIASVVSCSGLSSYPSSLSVCANEHSIDPSPLRVLFQQSQLASLHVQQCSLELDREFPRARNKKDTSQVGFRGECVELGGPASVATEMADVEAQLSRALEIIALHEAEIERLQRESREKDAIFDEMRVSLEDRARVRRCLCVPSITRVACWCVCEERRAGACGVWSVAATRGWRM
jgi:hypothetical protein